MSDTRGRLEFETDAGRAWFNFREGANDQHVIWASFCYDEYRLADVGEGDVAIDIGAHIGAVTLRLAMQGARVYAFEPVQENFDLLCHNVCQNGLGDMVSCYREAVTGCDALTTVYLGEAEWYRWMGGVFGETSRAQAVPGVSLDTIFERDGIKRCTVIKLDAEGSEYDILRRASADTLSRIDRIVGEHHGVKGGPVRNCRQVLLSYMRGEVEGVTLEDDVAGFDFVRTVR